MSRILKESREYIIDIDESKCWYKNDILHREDGPAVEYLNGDKYWYIDGKLHREDGPAVEWYNGDKEWYINGVHAKACSNCEEYIAELDNDYCYSCNNPSKSASKRC